jgi:hypothetical protein
MDNDVSGKYDASIFSAAGERSVPMGKPLKMQITPEAGYKTTRSLNAEDENVNYQRGGHAYAYTACVTQNS